MLLSVKGIISSFTLFVLDMSQLHDVVKIPRVDQNQHHCLVEKGDLQRLRDETPTKNQSAQRLRQQPHH
jgi:hypothetical protein